MFAAERVSLCNDPQKEALSGAAILLADAQLFFLIAGIRPHACSALFALVRFFIGVIPRAGPLFTTVES